jgi:hypothetical protein
VKDFQGAAFGYSAALSLAGCIAIAIVDHGHWNPSAIIGTVAVCAAGLVSGSLLKRAHEHISQEHTQTEKQKVEEEYLSALNSYFKSQMEFGELPPGLIKLNAPLNKRSMLLLSYQDVFQTY